jgi:hypothetical protein
VRALAIVILAACQSGSGRELAPIGGGAYGACALDADCVLAATSCCECPTFAVAISDPAHRGCAGIACPPLSCPNSVHAVCDTGTCALACAPLACALTCADGFAIGATGCLTCACASVTDPACASDADCVRTRADCCGCARGGADTAVAAGDVAAFDASLGCPASPSCPATGTCAADLAPRCLEGACQLLPPVPAGACGRTGLAMCSDGTGCTINVDADATAYGVGVCM